MGDTNTALQTTKMKYKPKKAAHNVHTQMFASKSFETYHNAKIYAPTSNTHAERKKKTIISINKIAFIQYQQ